MQLRKITPALVRRDLRNLAHGRPTSTTPSMLAHYALMFLPADPKLPRNDFKSFATKLWALPDTRSVQKEGHA